MLIPGTEPKLLKILLLGSMRGKVLIQRIINILSNILHSACRFLLSLGGCETCLVMDDELNVLPISAGKDVKPISKIEASRTISSTFSPTRNPQRHHL
jgi:hypothetical protein